MMYMPNCDEYSRSNLLSGVMGTIRRRDRLIWLMVFLGIIVCFFVGP